MLNLSANDIACVIVGVVAYVKLVIPLQTIFVDEIFVFVVFAPIVILFAFPVNPFRTGGGSPNKGR